MITRTDFEAIVAELRRLGWADDDIARAEGLCLPENAENFALEAAWAICNSGMKHDTACKIFEGVRDRLCAGGSAAHNHKGKSAAIDEIWCNRDRLFRAFLDSKDKIACLSRELPYFRKTTALHLARNVGMDCAKPDVHLKNLAKQHQTTPRELCEALARETGYRVGTIDFLLWRACAKDVIDKETGQVRFDSQKERPANYTNPRRSAKQGKAD